MKLHIKEKVEQAIADIKQGKIIILFDDVDRENEGDFIQSAQMVSAESVNFMISEGRGLLCCPISFEISQKFKLELQTADNTSLHHTAFTVSVDANVGATTGVSAQDRAITISTLANEHSVAQDLARPGHIFPIIAQEKGLQARAGHTEAAIALVTHAKHRKVAAICEILNEEGFAANINELECMAKKYNLILLHIEDIISYEQQLWS